MTVQASSCSTEGGGNLNELINEKIWMHRQIKVTNFTEICGIVSEIFQSCLNPLVMSLYMCCCRGYCWTLLTQLNEYLLIAVM